MLTQQQHPAGLLERELESCQLSTGMLLIIPDKEGPAVPECEREHGWTRGGEAGSTLPASCPQPCSELTGPEGFAPYINPVHVGGKAHRGFQESKQGQLLWLGQLSSPSSTSPTRCSIACSLLYLKQDLVFTFSLLCRFTQLQISKLIKRGMDWAYIFFFSRELLAEFLSCQKWGL